LVLARGQEGYHRLLRHSLKPTLATDDKDTVSYDLSALAEQGREHWLILTGCRKGAVREGLPPTVAHPLAKRPPVLSVLMNWWILFGADNVVVELFDHQHPFDSTHNDFLAELAHSRG
jgi:error-prone DNA polymerase